MKKDQLSLSLLLSQTNQSILQLQVLTTCSFTARASKHIKGALADVLAVAGLLLSFDLFAADWLEVVNEVFGPVEEPQVEAPVAAADPDPVADPADEEISDPNSGSDIPSDGGNDSNLSEEEEDGGVVFEEAPLEGEKKSLLIKLLEKTNWGLETPEGQRATAHNLVSGKDLTQACISISRYHRFLVKLMEQVHQMDQSNPEMFWENEPQGKSLTDQRKLVKGTLDSLHGKQIVQVLKELAPSHPGLRELELDDHGWLAEEPLNNIVLASELENQIWMWHIYMEGTVKEAILSHESLEAFIASEASKASEDTPIDARERVITFFPVTPEETSTPTPQESSTPTPQKSSTPVATKRVTKSSVRKQLFTLLKPPEPSGSSSKGS